MLNHSSMSSAVVSSSSTLWATASKEWVIPAKPKPGRKPKKDPQIQPVNDQTDCDTKGRRVQNRAAQRAFRERKQNQIADLQARVQLYEQGEIERNVALQTVSKRLKEENEALKKENARLLAEIESLRSNSLTASERKRQRDEELSQIADLDDFHRKRHKAVALVATPSPVPAAAPSFVSSPSPLVSSPEPCGPAQTTLSPHSFPTPSGHPNLKHLGGVQDSRPNQGKNNELKSLEYPSAMLDGIVDCGFCSEDTPCVCRELALQQRTSTYIASDGQTSDATHIKPISSSQIQEERMDHTASILDNLPAFQPPVPLKKRSSLKLNSEPVFRVIASSDKGPSCSGDPANCLACADDPFGQAFCAALDDAVVSNSTCTNCPKGGCGGPSPMSSGIPSPNASNYHGDEGHSETIPRAEAWKQLKSHPNAAFADLRLLAEVVARKTSCPGPLFDATESTNYPEPQPRNVLSIFSKSHSDIDDGNAIILTDPHARYHERHAPTAVSNPNPPTLVPQDILIRCGRERLLDVQAEGVRDALRLLDSRFAP